MVCAENNNMNGKAGFRRRCLDAWREAANPSYLLCTPRCGKRNGKNYGMLLVVHRLVSKTDRQPLQAARGAGDCNAWPAGAHTRGKECTTAMLYNSLRSSGMCLSNQAAANAMANTPISHTTAVRKGLMTLLTGTKKV